MEVFENYIYFGGGGGYEIPNMIQGYRLPAAGETLLKDKPIFEMKTDDAVANYMTLARDVSLPTPK